LFFKIYIREGLLGVTLNLLGQSHILITHLTNLTKEIKPY
jgi:hypothetical protein